MDFNGQTLWQLPALDWTYPFQFFTWGEIKCSASKAQLTCEVFVLDGKPQLLSVDLDAGIGIHEAHGIVVVARLYERVSAMYTTGHRLILTATCQLVKFLPHMRKTADLWHGFPTCPNKFRQRASQSHWSQEADQTMWTCVWEHPTNKHVLKQGKCQVVKLFQKAASDLSFLTRPFPSPHWRIF